MNPPSFDTERPQRSAELSVASVPVEKARVELEPPENFALVNKGERNVLDSLCETLRRPISLPFQVSIGRATRRRRTLSS